MQKSNDKPGLLLLNMSACHNSTIKDLKTWSEISKFIGNNQSLVDRSGLTTMPVRMKVSPTSHIPQSSREFKKSYEQICNERAEEIVNVQKKIDKPIALLYSGGIDSTMVLISFLKILGADEFKNRVIIYMTQDSIAENPELYYNFIRKIGPRIRSSTQFKEIFETDQIIVDAEFNDQLHGSLLVYDLFKYFDESIMHKKFELNFLKDIFRRKKMSEDSITSWSEYFQFVLENQKVFEIQTLFDFFWWFNFVYKWQSVYYRIPLRVLPSTRDKINESYLAAKHFHFFSTLDFQRWALVNPEKRIQTSWSSYKWHVKDLIFDFTKDSNYRVNKLKVGSLYNLFLQSDTPKALTSDFNFLYEINFQDFYEQKNSFRFS